MEKLEDEEVVADLDERRDRRVAERGVGRRDHAPKIGRGDLAVDERAHDGFRDLGVAAAGESRDGVARKRRPALRHVEAAVARKAGKERVGEADRGRLAAGGDVQHGRPWG